MLNNSAAVYLALSVFLVQVVLLQGSVYAADSVDAIAREPQGQVTGSQIKRNFLLENIGILELALAKNPDMDERIAAPLKVLIKEYRYLSSRFASGLQQIKGLDDQFAGSRRAFNKTTAEYLRNKSHDMDRLIAVLKQNIDIMRGKPGENAARHADLLNLAKDAVVSHKESLQERLTHFSSDYKDIGGNFIYLPEDLGSSVTKSLVSRLAAINTSLVERTFDRKKDVVKLTEQLDQLYRVVLAEKEQVGLLFGGLPENFSAVVEKNRDGYNIYLDKIISLQKDIAKIREMFIEIGSENSGEIIYDYDRSYKIVRLNQELEEIAAEQGVLDRIGGTITLQVVSIIKKTFDYNGENNDLIVDEQLKPLSSISEKRAEKLADVEGLFENIKDSLQKDAKSFESLNMLGQDIMARYLQESQTILPEIKTALDANSANKTSDYYGYLEAVYTELKERVALFDLFVKRKHGKLDKSPGIGEGNISLWDYTAKLDQSYPDILKEIGNFAQVVEIFSQEQFVPEKFFDQASTLFAISRLLKIPLAISIENGRAVIEFTLHGKTVRIEGLGNPALDLVFGAAGIQAEVYYAAEFISFF